MILAGDFIPQTKKVWLGASISDNIVLANLEGPVCADGLPVSDKVGVCLHSAPFEISGQWAFSLANNHMMDFRKEGLRQTQVFLSNKGYAFAGAGETEEEARRPMVLEEGGVRIAVFSCCELQFGMATPFSAGVAAMGVWLYKAIHDVKANGEADFVIISCHAASEFSPWPSPQLREFYHTLIDAGADVIHGHHAHVPQGWEIYRGRPIFFGLGNFAVDPDMWVSNPNQLWSLVVNIHFSNEDISFSVIPYRLYWDAARIVLRTMNEKNSTDGYMAAINAPFSDGSAIPLEALWQEAAVRLYPRIYAQGIRAPGVGAYHLSLRDRVRKAYFAFRDLGYALCGREWATQKSLFYAKCLYNSFNCPSHHQAISTALGVLTGVDQDLRSEVTRRLAEDVGV